jgi:hypothetical protein
MAIAQVNVLALVSNQLPGPKDDPFGQYSGGRIMDGSNIVVVNTARAISAAFAERDTKIEALQRDLNALTARLAGSSRPKARTKSGSPKKRRLGKH